jgi:serine acetyltransferase
MPGVRIGRNSVVGAGAIVTHDVPPNSVAVGAPARVVRDTEQYLKSALRRGVHTKGLSSQDKRRVLEDMFKGR